MKKSITAILLFVMCVTAVIGLSGCSKSMKILIRGENIVCDILPIEQDGEVFYPLDNFCDAIDASYKFTPYENTVTITKGIKVEFLIDKDIIIVDGHRGELQNRPIFQNEVVFIPVNEVATALGYEVEQKSNKLIITETLSLITKETNETETTYYEYDDNGNLLKESSEDYFRTYEYDENENLLFVYNDDGTIAESYKYNEKGRVVEKTEGSYIHKFDDRGNQIYREGSDGRIIEARYDHYNNTQYYRIKSTNGEGDFIYNYDDKSRLISITGTEPTTYTYEKHIIIKERECEDGSKETTIQDYNGKTLYFSNDQIRKIEDIKYTENTVEIVAETGKWKYVFNDLNLIIEEEWDGNNPYKNTYTYDKYGNLLTMKDKDGNKVASYVYNDLGKIIESSLNGKLYEKYKYNDQGDVVYIEDYYGNTVNYAYDENGYLRYKEVKKSSTSNISEFSNYRKGTTLCEYMTVKK